MTQQNLKASLNRLTAEELEIRVRDTSMKILYKRRVNINNKKEVASALSILEKYGISMEDLVEEMKKAKKGHSSFFHYPLGNKIQKDEGFNW